MQVLSKSSLHLLQLLHPIAFIARIIPLFEYIYFKDKPVQIGVIGWIMDKNLLKLQTYYVPFYSVEDTLDWFPAIT